jgi:competence protein ComGC
MDLGKYIDGRAVTYDQGTGTFRIGDAPVSVEQVRWYLAAGHIAWSTVEIASWFNSTFPAAPAPTPQRTRSGAFIAIITAVVVVVLLVCGILSAIAIPIFSGAKTSAQQKACFANERMVEGAAQSYLADNGALPKSVEALVPELIQTVPVCPSGGAYSWDSTSGKYTCSKHGNYADQ